jgi:hypothetical protein
MKVKYIAKNGTDYDHAKNKRLLLDGKEYTVESIRVGSFVTSIMLENFPGVMFNSVCFAVAEENSHELLSSSYTNTDDIEACVVFSGVY